LIERTKGEFEEARSQRLALPSRSRKRSAESSRRPLGTGEV